MFPHVYEFIYDAVLPNEYFVSISRCMDLDGDGFLSMYELEYFYDEQLQRMEAMGIECLPFEDCLCQVCILTNFYLYYHC